MAQSIPTTEPTSARAGDTWRWTRALSSYPADAGWTLTYVLWSASEAINITASADGSDHLIDISPVVTAAYTAGRYDWAARVSDGSDIYTVGTGIIQILPALGAAMDTRSHARRMLDAINAMLEERATDGDVDVVRTAIGGRSTDYDLPTLIKLRQQYAALVASEDAAAAAARGEHPGMVQMRF